MNASTKNILKKHFGFNDFRPLQEDIVNAVIQKKDCLVVMPTGGGKSLCYQLPAITQDGLTVVISPLIALMKDQVEGLRENGIEAHYINSSVDISEINNILNSVTQGITKLLYVSPEKMMTTSFQNFLKTTQVSLFAIDEAHCISQWGHDFRTEYTQLGILKQLFPTIPVIALTATADHATRKDIIAQLRLHDTRQFISSFDRPNIRLTVMPAKQRIKKIISYIAQRPQESGIIYCLSRKQTERVTMALRDEGYDADYYHAGMASHERNTVQENFIRGKTPIIVATIAFGMGIDKSNVRYVIHHNLPKNIEGYYQEIGRAGRDGLSSEAVLFYTLSDVVLLRQFAQDSGQKELQLAKLERMQQYADALNCRRRILLSYFGEHTETNCNNCDVCDNPPELIDATEITQKALSAIYRLDQRVAINMLIDVLRGSHRQDIISRGYDKIPTFGTGKHIPPPDWQHYILQMLNMGLVDIAYDQNHVLKITPLGIAVLRSEKQVSCVSLSSIEAHALKRQQERQERTPSKRQQGMDGLFQHLRELRKDIAHKADIPPYLVFSDATLDEMCRIVPMNERDMKRVSGVGDKKFHSYGTQFIHAISTFILELDKQGIKLPGTSEQITYTYYRQHIPIRQIAEMRGLKPTTIYAHLATLYDDGYDITITDFLSKHDIKKLVEEFKSHGIPEQLKPLYIKFNEQFDYGKLRLAIAYYRREFERGVVRY